MNATAARIKDALVKTFPDAKCELNYHNIYELSVAVILSAQTTDKSVNLVTPSLFSKYPDLNALASANLSDVEDLIKRIGLYKNKAKSITNFAGAVISRFGGVIPKTIEELITLPGVGRKTANVIISEGYHLPGLAVDVHVARVSKRIGLVSDEDSPEVIETKLKQLFEASDWHQMHHLLIFLGRYLCEARKPKCDDCPFQADCKYFQSKKTNV